MAIRPGSRLGPYEVTALIGEGGMGRVWRAHHAGPKRDDALKVLPDAFASDADRVARFQREAQVLASLNHPNIAHVYGLERADGVQALIMELVEGPTLADRIGRGPLSVDEALPIARQIAEALVAAHEQGIIHRDLKPANIKLRPDGTVKVLDFGLAKAFDSSPSAVGTSQSPTITSPAMMTGVGVLLGTAAYMSPEQARGKTVDRRTDIWAFGCVLYEMLTGVRAFPGDDVSETLAAIIKAEPDWRALGTDTPPSVRRLLRRCLIKDPKARMADASTARLEIDDALAPHADETSPLQTPRHRERIMLISGLIFTALVATAAILWVLRPSPTVPALRLDIITPPTTDPLSMAISADGQKLAFVAAFEGRSQLWVRSLDSGEVKPLAGTDGARFPCWSPDSLSIGFFAEERFRRIDLNGGLVQVLTRIVGSGAGCSWGGDGTVLFNGNSGVDPISRITATGSQAVAVTRFASPQESAHRFLSFLPDARHFVFYVAGAPTVSGVYVGAIDGSVSNRLVDAESRALYSPSGHLLFVKQGTLFAQAFDPDRLVLEGNAIPVAEHVATGATTAAFSIGGGRIVYRAGSAGGGHRQLAWFDRSGMELASVGSADTNGNAPALSRDGSRIVLQRGSDIWLLERNLLTRLVTSPSLDVMPLWSPDDQRIVFTSGRSGVADLYLKPIGAANEELLLASPEPKIANDWSSDGRFLLYGSQSQKTGNDLFALPMLGDKTPIAIAQTDFDERNGQFSPDGKWVAFQSNDSSRDEIYLQPFPEPGIRQRVSTEGGGHVRWRRDGKELFYVDLEGRLMAVPVAADTGGEKIQLGPPAPLFTTRLGDNAATFIGNNRQAYMVAADGKRFLINTVVEEVVTTPISIIVNWKP